MAVVQFDLFPSFPRYDEPDEQEHCRVAIESCSQHVSLRMVPFLFPKHVCRSQDSGLRPVRPDRYDPHSGLRTGSALNLFHEQLLATHTLSGILFYLYAIFRDDHCNDARETWIYQRIPHLFNDVVLWGDAGVPT